MALRQKCWMGAGFAVFVATASALADSPAASQPDWVQPARQVHARFTGTAGTVGQYGDSITYSKAFFSNMFWGEFKFADDADRVNLDRLRKQVPRACADWKGPEHGNYSGWKIEDVLKVIDQVLARDNPEIALVMIGTNDLNGSPDPADKEFVRKLASLIDKLHANGTIAILHTIPPKRGKMAAVQAYNKAIRELACARKMPLIDYYEEVLARRPDDWDGSLISGDGIHPSFPKQFQQDFTEAGLNASGHTLRNYLALKMWAKVKNELAARPTTQSATSAAARPTEDR